MPRRPKSRAKTSLVKAKDKSNGNGALTQGRVTSLDYFTNMLARMGYGTPSLTEGTTYDMVRLSNNYWLMLTMYRNHWLSRRIVDLPAQDMTRAWPKLVTDMEPDQIKDFDRTLDRTYTKRKVRQALKWARLYGGAGALMVIKGHENILGEPLDLDDVLPDSYLGLIPFDRWVGITPTGTVLDDMDHPRQFGLPEHYEVWTPDTGQSFKVHASRILRFTGPEIPTPEMQAQVYWGISVLELAYEELRKKDNASWSILQLLFRANIIARVDPQLDQFLSGLGTNQAALQKLNQVLQAQNDLLSNQSMMVLGKEGDMKAIQYPFSGIGEVYAQFQMDVAGAAEIPVTRLFGRTITGLGQSNDADERYYEEMIAQKADEELRPALDQLYPVICMSEFGEVPDDLDMFFPSIRVLSEEDKADKADKVTTAVLAAFSGGVISQEIALKELRQLGDTTNIFTNITDEDIDKAEKEPMLPGEQQAGPESEKNEEGKTESEAENEAGGGKGNMVEFHLKGKAKAGDARANDDRPILVGHVGKDGYFACPTEFTTEDEVRWAKNRMRSSRIAQYADQSCGLPHTYDKDGAYLCGGRADGGSEPCNMLKGAECLIRIKPLPQPLSHTTSCMYWERPNSGDPEGRVCPQGKLDDERLDFGSTKNPKGFGCIRCEDGQQLLPRPDSEGRRRWCRVKDHSVANNSCCADNDPVGVAKDTRALAKRLKWHGLDISIENEAGSVREGIDRGGNRWRVKLTHDYGYLRKTQGVDGDHVDCFVGDYADADKVYVVHTRKAPDFIEYDEDKCFLNFKSAADALKAFFSNYDRPEHFAFMDTMAVDSFIEKVLATKDDSQMVTH